MSTGNQSHSLSNNVGHYEDIPKPQAHTRRPYQAYCVTAPPTRASSPQTLGKTSTEEDSHTISNRSTVRSNPSRHSSRRRQTNSLQGNDGQHKSSGISTLTPGNASTNQELDSDEAILVNDDHITRPRGNHPVASTQTIVYHQTPSSHPRYQHSSRDCQSLPKEITTIDHDSPHNMSRPLPPLPLDLSRRVYTDEVDALLPEIEPVEAQTADLVAEHSYRPSLYDEENEGQRAQRYLSHRKHRSESRIPLLPISKNHHVQDPQDWRSKRGSLYHLASPPLANPPNDRTRKQHNTNINSGDAQIASSPDLYSRTRRGCSLSADIHAHRRTQPKDAKLRYEFGRRLSNKIQALPASISTIRQSAARSTSGYKHIESQPSMSELSLSSPSLHSSIEVQIGPRPPPWGSYDTLELQRRERIETREQVSMQNLRNAHNGMITSQRQQHGLRMTMAPQDMRREVEESRAQVLSLYPDIQFDGNAGQDGAYRCCCVIM